jgi:ABC-2 type transport system permease protein
MNSFLLKLLDLFQGLFRLVGVNYLQLRAIVSIKLIMDNRRQLVSYRRKDNQEPENTFLWTMFFYVLFGGFVALGLYGIPSFILSMIMFFSYIMVMVAMTLITDFSAILLDTSDNTIILPRPVNSRTLFVSRIVHIFLYVGQITIGLSVIPAIVILLKYGVGVFVLFIFATVLSVITSVFITNAFYLLILQFANEERLKNVINYFQIVMAVFIMGGYQLLPRLAGRLDVDEFYFDITWWSFIAPPVWMAAALEMYYHKIYDLGHITLTVCALTIPVAGFYLVNRFLTPVFARKLGVMGTETQHTRLKIEKKSFAAKISGWLTFSALERAAFEMVYHVLGRDRKIKLKIYPTFGYVIVFALIFTFRGKDDFATTWSTLSDTQYHLLMLYFAFMILQVAFYELPYSDDFKASWIYFSTPIQKPGEILTGTLKAVIVRLFVPGYLLISLVVIAIWKAQAIDDVVFALFNNIIMVLLILLINKRSLPLSIAPNVRNQAGNFIRSLLMVIMVGALGLVHYVLAKNTLILIAVIPIQWLTIYVLYSVYRKTSWDQLTL